MASFLKNLCDRTKSLKGIVSRSFTVEVQKAKFATPETTLPMDNLREVAAVVPGTTVKVKPPKGTAVTVDAYGAAISLKTITYDGSALATDLIDHCDTIDGIAKADHAETNRVNGKKEKLPVA